MPSGCQAAKRLVDRPILDTRAVNDAGLVPKQGRPNINGPCLVRADVSPAEPAGRYFLYYSHHHGNGIGLAVADRPEGPYRNLGCVLHIDRTPFSGHVASPHVEWDPQRGVFEMILHGEAFTEDACAAQVSVRAWSPDGQTFECEQCEIGPAYLRPFHHAGRRYAIGWGGTLVRLADETGPLEIRRLHFHDDLCPPSSADPHRGNVRHVGLRKVGARLGVFYSIIGDTPERILRSEVTLSGDWTTWRASAPTDVLAPDRPWEGAELARLVEPGREPGALGRHRPACAVRDPFVLDDDGKTLMVYAAAGEQCLGIAELG